jgi:hypothetical protein
VDHGGESVLSRAAQNAAVKARYHERNPGARLYRCRRCQQLGHTVKTCTNDPVNAPAVVVNEGIVVRIQCSCGARIAGTFSPDEVMQVLAAHRHVRRRA